MSNSSKRKKVGETEIQLRRNTMNFTRLIFTAFSLIAIIIAGCSGDGQVTGPGNPVAPDINRGAVVTVTQADIGYSARIESGSPNSDFSRQLKPVEFQATVKKSDIEGGCWYLETKDSDTYMPVFDENDLVLQKGMELLVSGYVDFSLNSICQVGPVVRIEKYEILSSDGYIRTAAVDTEKRNEQNVESTSKNYITDDPVLEEDKSPVGMTALKGYKYVNEEGCMYLASIDEIIAELEFSGNSKPEFSGGELAYVKGKFSLLTTSPCQLGPLFHVEKIQLTDDKDLKSNSELAIE
jgi:hypothetical protein